MAVGAIMNSTDTAMKAMMKSQAKGCFMRLLFEKSLTSRAWRTSRSISLLVGSIDTAR